MTEPYYQDDHVTIYHAECQSIIDEIVFDAIVTDPPYGISANTANRSSGRSALAVASDYPAIQGDDSPFDPSWMLEQDVPLVCFGANHFANKLPPSASWLVWDKIDGLKSKRSIGFNDSADAELAWSNLGGPVRIHRQRWMGTMQNGREARRRRVHPTQKPVELMGWVLSQVKASVVLDPYAGSGPTLQAAKEANRKAIGIEIEERYCEIAARRCAQEVLPF